MTLPVLKNGVTCKQTRTYMSEDTLESHIIYGLKDKYPHTTQTALTHSFATETYSNQNLP